MRSRYRVVFAVNLNISTATHQLSLLATANSVSYSYGETKFADAKRSFVTGRFGSITAGQDLNSFGCIYEKYA
jgi:hypothetical protein